MTEGNYGDSTAGAPAIALDDVLEILDRRRWWLVLGAVLGLAAGAAVWAVLPNEYTASTSILVEPQEVPQDYVRSTITIEVEQRLDTLRERVTSYAKLNELIDTIGEERLDPTGQRSREDIMAAIRSGLTVELGSDFARSATVFHIHYTGRDPDVVADVTREIASLFITENIRDRQQQAAETASFLDRELSRLRQDVAAHEERIREFKEKNLGALPSQLDSNLRALDRLNNELAASIEAQEQISHRVALIRTQIQTASTSVGPGGAAAPDDLSSALLAARAELLQAERVYTEQHPNVIRLRAEVKRLEEQIQQQAENGGQDMGPQIVSPMVAQLRVELEQANSELARRRQDEERLRRQIAQYQERVESAPGMEQASIALTRDYQNLNDTYQQLLAKRYEAALAKNLEAAQKAERFKVLQPPQTPTSPSWPVLYLFAPAGMGVGLVLVLLLIGFAEFRNPSFRSVARLSRQIGLPVVASVPRIDNDRIYDRTPTGDVDTRLVVYTAPESAPAEQYRGFAPLFLDDEEKRVVLVTSAQRGDGKSLTCMNLALTIACDLNRKVLVIDGDLRRPTAHRLLRLKSGKGLTDVLRHQAKLGECAVNSKVPNLTLLPAGRTTRNPLGLITDQAFLDLIAQARNEFDAIFIDSPPLLPVVDTKLLRRMADRVLFVVRADSTPREAVIRSMRDLRGVSGVVFNEVSPGSFRRYYYYDAYATYAYGDPVVEGEEGADAEVRDG